MKNMLVLVTAFVVVAYGSAGSADGFDTAFVEDTKAYLSRLEKLGFAGTVLVAQNGEPVIAEGYGLANREKAIGWTPSTVSTIGSITKQFTAAAILVLQEQDKVNVQEGLDKYFSDVPDDKSKITLHHLLTHSSGIVDPPNIDDFDQNTREEYVRIILEAPLESEPGERYEYANANFSLLGAIVELETGKSYEVALHELIFQPAGLKETGYTLPEWDEERLAIGYVGDERWGTVLERPMADDGPYWALRANGGIYSTSEDMLRWAQALLGNRVLSPESRDAMWTPHVDESNGDGSSFYGYGWVVDRKHIPHVVMHNGGNGILFADFAIMPDENIVAFVQTNVVADFRVANDLLAEIGARLFGSESYPDVPEVADIDPATLDAWAGTYQIDNGDRLDVSIDGNALRVVPSGWKAYAVIHSLPEQDTQPLVEMSAEIDRIVGAYVEGDFGPMFEAYRRQVPAERLKEMYESRQREREAEHGPFKGYEILGTGTGDRYHFTSVRFNYERGEILRTYVWERGETSKLLGITTRRMDPGCRFFPVEGGHFQSWEPATGASVSARLDKTPDGAAFVLLRTAGEVIARR
jgi:CubicO group peptidase (beta-lactamase class C family)